MRNTSSPGRGSWATFAKSARQAARLSQAELARRVGVDRTTVYRWETGAASPEDPLRVQLFAEVVGVDVLEALAAAGFRPDIEAPARPSVVERDEELELVRTDPKLDDAMRERIIALILERRERERAAALEETRRLIELFRRS